MRINRDYSNLPLDERIKKLQQKIKFIFIFGLILNLVMIAVSVILFIFTSVWELGVGILIAVPISVGMGMVWQIKDLRKEIASLQEQLQSDDNIRAG